MKQQDVLTSAQRRALFRLIYGETTPAEIERLLEQESLVDGIPRGTVTRWVKGGILDEEAWSSP